MIAYFAPAIVAACSLSFSGLIDYLVHIGNVRVAGDDK